MTATNDSEDGGDTGTARYAVAVRFRLDASTLEWWPKSPIVEWICYRRAVSPGEPGWLFFRDHLWRGEFNHPDHLADLVEEAFGLPVEHVEFRGLRTDETYFEDLKREISTDPTRFNADSVSEVLNKYLGSAIRVEK